MTSASKIAAEARKILSELGVGSAPFAERGLAAKSPIDGAELAVLRETSVAEASERIGGKVRTETVADAGREPGPPGGMSYFIGLGRCSI